MNCEPPAVTAGGGGLRSVFFSFKFSQFPLFCAISCNFPQLPAIFAQLLFARPPRVLVGALCAPVQKCCSLRPRQVWHRKFCAICPQFPAIIPQFPVIFRSWSWRSLTANPRLVVNFLFVKYRLRTNVHVRFLYQCQTSEETHPHPHPQGEAGLPLSNGLPPGRGFLGAKKSKESCWVMPDSPCTALEQVTRH